MEFSFTYDHPWSPNVVQHCAIQANNMPYETHTSYHVVSLVPLERDEEKRVILHGVRLRKGHSEKEEFVDLHVDLETREVSARTYKFSDLFKHQLGTDGEWVRKETPVDVHQKGSTPQSAAHSVDI